MSRSIHQTLKSVYGGKPISEIKAMVEPGNIDTDVLALMKKTAYKRLSGRGKFKPKPLPEPIQDTTSEDE